jgi:flagellar FliJ protein
MTGSSFTFSLERVRALRERTEDAAKEALAGAMAEHARSETRLDEAARRVAAARQAQLEATATPVSATDLLARQAWLERSERAHQDTQADLGRTERVVSQRRQALTEAAQDRQALERLKENRRLDHQRELARQENMAMDEIAITSFRRRAAA